MNKSGTYHFHLISDASGETIRALTRACLVQFDDIPKVEHHWSLIRTKRQLRPVIEGIKAEPGMVLYTLVNAVIRDFLEMECKRMNVPCVSVLDPVMKALGGYLGVKSKARPGQQHQLDAEYFDRIEAMDFALATDDGQRTRDYKEADVVVIGVSRTSKTPTCIYLANQGIKAANVPFIPGTPLPDALDERKDGLIVGLTKDPKRLVQIRRNRLRMLHQEDETDYTDPELVKREVRDAHRFFVEKGWPVIDVTRRSIEETAAAILGLLEHRSTAPGNAPDRT
ncbi:MAG: kinase/pyrophosphorylase [Alphaproteobacteria bacterium]|nr:MAG: kinase/pyrophosphorylase [Alphaproteobacteria bacterium]